MIDVFDMNNKRDLELKCIYDEKFAELEKELKKELEEKLQERVKQEEEKRLHLKNKYEIKYKDLIKKNDLELKCIYDEMYENKLQERLKQAEEKIEKENKLKIAKNLLDLNMSINDISRVTGLTKEEIEKINT